MTNTIKLWDIPGGIHPPQNKTQSLQLPLGKLPVPPQLVIPLNQHTGASAKPVVNIGDRVLAGQLIAAAEGVFSANVHASSSGVVSAIGMHVATHSSGMGTESITISTDGEHRWIELEPCGDFASLERLALLDKIHAAGVIGLGGAGFPTAIKLATKATQQIDTLVINGAECEPYITADDMLMQTRADQVIAGSLLLSHILHNPQRVVIGVEDNKPQAIAALKRAAEKAYTDSHVHIEIASIPTQYPSGGARQLIQILTGRETPSGHHSASIGAICINVGTVVAAWRAVRYGEPLISRITTIAGEALASQRNIEVLIGTPINYALDHHGFNPANAARVIVGGSLMGFTLPDLRAPILKTTNCLIAADKKELPPPPPAQACIRCGLCSEVCPASLLPQQLFWYAQAQDTDRLRAHNLFDCIECGACSYVCPSNIPLVQYYRAAKGTIRQQVADKAKADRSRARFEFRQQRFAKEELEKEAKREARKKAADIVKQKLAEQNTAAALTTDITELVTPQTAPLVNVGTKTNTVQFRYDDEKARLERIIAAARNSVASARAPLVPRNIDIPITEEQLIKQQARIKQTELKLKEAEKKLADFIAEHSTADLLSAGGPAAGDPAAGGPAADSPAVEDPVLATIARAQAKLAISPADKLRSNIESLQARLLKAQEKAEEAKAQGATHAAALALAVEKLQQKITDVEVELKDIASTDTTPGVTAPEQHAAMVAIERAKTKAVAQAAMSDAEKRAEHIALIELRLEKSRARLARAEAENDPNIAAFRSAVTKLEDKLQEP